MKAQYSSSNRPRSSSLFTLMNLMLIVALVVVIGCDQNPAQAPLLDDPAGLSADNQVMGKNSSNDISCHEASGLITVAEGGDIQLGWGGPQNVMTLTPGSVSEDVVIEVTTCIVKGNPDGQSPVLEFDFGPDGLFFTPSAQIVFNAGSLNALRAPSGGGVVQIYYYDPDTDSWTLYQESEIVKGKITFDIGHFSKFGISHRSAW